ncbi:MAG: hypothetical protein NTY30_04490 [Candidatus Berkelbacteria bacterium]|nr:hypothetical protein [Candidatus Berkelbacteria bacterium]
MSRVTLGIVGVLSALWGIWALIPAWKIASMSIPAWMSWFAIIVGIIILIIAISDSKE